MSDPRDPFDGGDALDRTVVIPRPMNTPQPKAQPSAAPAHLASVKDGFRHFGPEAYPDPLVRAAAPLLLHAASIIGTETNQDSDALRRTLAAEIRAFDQQAKTTGLPPNTLTMARYLLCTLLDEFVMMTPWGSRSSWRQNSLLNEFHNETSGGERAFDIIAFAMRDPASHGSLLELAFLVLNLGFRGKYSVGDQAELMGLKSDIRHILTRSRPVPATEFSPQWRGAEAAGTERLARIAPPQIVAAASIAAMLLAYLGFSLAINRAHQPFFELSEQVRSQRNEDIITAAPVPVSDPVVFRPVLEPYFGGAVKAEVEGTEATIRVDGSAGSVFASGSASLNSEGRTIAQLVAAILADLEGPISITGHTDSVGKIASNRALSLRRAETFRDALMASGIDGDRVTVRGAGSDRPFASPERNAADRALNRRVELRFRVPEGSRTE